MESASESRYSRFGIYAVILYALVVVGSFAYGWFSNKPGYLGFNWIPFLVLALPWSKIFDAPAVAGVVLNAGLLYLFGALVERSARPTVESARRGTDHFSAVILHSVRRDRNV